MTWANHRPAINHPSLDQSPARDQPSMSRSTNKNGHHQNHNNKSTNLAHLLHFLDPLLHVVSDVLDEQVDAWTVLLQTPLGFSNSLRAYLSQLLSRALDLWVHSNEPRNGSQRKPTTSTIVGQDQSINDSRGVINRSTMVGVNQPINDRRISQPINDSRRESTNQHYSAHFNRPTIAGVTTRINDSRGKSTDRR